MSQKIFKTVLVISLGVVSACASVRKPRESCVFYVPVAEIGAPDQAPVLACVDQFGQEHVRPIESVRSSHACFPIDDLNRVYPVKVAE